MRSLFKFVTLSAVLALTSVEADTQKIDFPIEVSIPSSIHIRDKEASEKTEKAFKQSYQKEPYQTEFFNFEGDCVPLAINNHDWILGLQHKDSQCHQYYLWSKENGFRPLPFSVTYQAPKLNNHNQVAGIYWRWKTHWFTPETASKYLYVMNADGHVHEIDPPWPEKDVKKGQFGEKNLGVIDFNDSGYILVGNGTLATANRFAIWNNHHFHYIPPEDLSYAIAMNNAGMILGEKTVLLGNQLKSILVLYDPLTRSAEEIFDGSDCLYMDLNDLGEVCFTILNRHKKIARGYVWSTERGLIPLNSFLPLVINNSGRMIGRVFHEEMGPYAVRDRDADKNLFEYDHRGSLLRDLNDHGHVVGAQYSSFKTESFRLIPNQH
ncbi:MAG: hypothetical protein ACXWM7_04150 [Parachlamydiaceae bacterium]